MARNISGIMTLVAGNPVVSGTDIEADWANTTLADVANEITDSLSRSGRGGMLAQFKAFAGTQTAPGWSWSLEPRSGIYRAGTGDFRFVIDGVEVATLNEGGINTAIGYIPQTVPAAGAYTFVLADNGRHIYKDDAADLTIPPNSSVNFPIGSTISVYNNNASAANLLRGSGVELRIAGSVDDDDRLITGYSYITILQFDTNKWLAIGGGVG